MDESAIVPKRPWTIKVFIAVFGLMFGISLIGGLSNPSKSWVVIYHLMIMALIIGIWQGRYWARNVFLVLMIPFFLITFFLAVNTFLNFGSLTYSENLRLLFSSILSVILILIPFSKSVQTWFDDLNLDKSKEHDNKLAWQFQLIIIIVSIALGFIVLSLNLHFEFLSLVTEWVKSSRPSYWNKVAIFLFSINLSILISAFIVEFPFGLILGYWKRGHRFLLLRLIAMGVFFPLYVSNFVLGNPTEHYSFFVAIAVTNLIVMSAIALFGLVMGEKMARYIDTLRVPIGIK